MKKYLKVLIVIFLIIIGIESFFIYRNYNKTNTSVVFIPLPSTAPIQEKSHLLYKTNNALLFNSSRGNNYLVGLLQEIIPIDNSLDKTVILKEANTDKIYKFRMVFEITEVNDKTIPLTMVGEEDVDRIEGAKERSDILNYVTKVEGKPAVNLVENEEFLDQLKVNDLLTVNFIGCNIDSLENCIRDNENNIYILGLYRRINSNN